METRWGAIAGWAVDFLRAARERPIWARHLMRIALGKWAYREFIGLMDELERNGFMPYMSYELESMTYHSDKVPFDWWEERSPLPLRPVNKP